MPPAFSRVLVAGGTGALGTQVVAELKRRGVWVRLLTRHPDRAPLDVDDIVHADLLEASSLADACTDVEAVFSAAGASLHLGLMRHAPGYRAVDYAGNKHLLDAALAAGVKKFVYVSVFNTPALNELVYVRAHTDFAAALRRADLDYAVIEPTGFFAAFGILPRIIRWGLAPLIGTGEARTNPIHEKDLAVVCADALEQRSGVFPVGGPEVLTRRAIFALAFNAIGKHPRFARIPNGILAFNRRLVAGLDPRLGDLLAFFQAVNQTDIVAPPQGTHRLDAFFREVVARKS